MFQPFTTRPRTKIIQKFKTLRFKRFYDINPTDIQIKENEVINVSRAKAMIAKCLREESRYFDIAQNCKIREAGDDVIITQLVEVIVHPRQRHLPWRMQTSKPDCTTFETDESTAKMSCGHHLTPDNLYSCCLSQLNDKKQEFKCPCCSGIWSLQEVVEKACLSKDESSFFEKKLNFNFVQDLKACPVCKTYCDRIDPDKIRVVCLYCKKNGEIVSEFCWDCCCLWNANHVCHDTKEEMQQRLHNCPRITMQYSNMNNVPKLRACPKCSTVIEHDGGCKTMDCGYCKETFCFCCLKLAVNGRLPCGSYSSVCRVAPIQEI